MSGPPRDFEDFVTARWRELHAVAAVATGDAGHGARVTASALAALGRRWSETTTTGAPTATARRAVLSAALAAARREDASVRGAAKTAETQAAVEAAETQEAAEAAEAAETQEAAEAVDADEDALRDALGAVLAAASPTARAALAVEHFWDEAPALVAATARKDLAAVEADLSRLHGLLAAAHAAVLGRDEQEIAWSVPAAVADTLEHLAGATPVTDPVALVAAERARAGRRHRTRLAAVGAALALVVGAGTALVWAGPGTAAPTGPGRDDPAWASVRTWGARGPLVDDPTVASISTAARRADITARLLYAGRVGDTVAVVMTGASPRDPTLPAGVPGPALGEGFDREQSFLRLWTASARLGPASLAPTTIDGEPTARTDDLVALSVGQDTVGSPPAVLVLTRPSVTDGFVITGALPQPDGSVHPVVVGLPLVDGVATFAPSRIGFIPEVDVAGYRGVPAGGLTDSFLLPPSGPADQLAVVQRILVSGVTGNRPDSLETTSVLEAVVPASAIDPDYVGTYPDFVGTHPEPLRVTVVTTTTPDGGRVRTSRLAGPTDEAPWTYLERLAAVPSTDPHALLPLPSGTHPGFVAIAPDGATAQLVTGDGRVRDSATISQGLATLSSTEDPRGTAFRLLVRAPDGHVVYDAVPPEPVELLDSGAVAD